MGEGKGRESVIQFGKSGASERTLGSRLRWRGRTSPGCRRRSTTHTGCHCTQWPPIGSSRAARCRTRANSRFGCRRAAWWTPICTPRAALGRLLALCRRCGGSPTPSPVSQCKVISPCQKGPFFAQGIRLTVASPIPSSWRIKVEERTIRPTLKTKLVKGRVKVRRVSRLKFTLTLVHRHFGTCGTAPPPT